MGGITQQVTSLFGGGPNNSQTTAQRADIHTPVTEGQISRGYEQAQHGLNAQEQMAYQLANQNGMGNQYSTFQQQQQLAQALQNQANGVGPNPAQAMLAQSTGQNVANQSAMMAGQRGAGANVGMMARQAGQQGAATQQQAVGQAATMGAQQQLAAQNQLMQQQGNMQNVAGQQINNAMQGAQSFAGNALQNQNSMLGGIGNYNNAVTANQGNMNSANSAMAQTNANNSAKFVSGLMNSAGGAMSGGGGGAAAGGMASGGIVENKKLAKVSPADRMPIPDHIRGMAEIYHPTYINASKMADGGEVTNSPEDSSSPYAIANSSQVEGMKTKEKKKDPAKANYAGADTAPQSKEGFSGTMKAAEGGEVTESPEDHSSAAPIANASQVGPSKGGGGIDPKMLAMLMAKNGAMVPGEAKVDGDDEKNDTVPAMLSPGEAVIPRSVMNSDDPIGGSAKFVKALMAKHGTSLGQEENDFKGALQRSIASRKKK